MDGYAPPFTAHNIPLLLVSGLSSESNDSQPYQSNIPVASTTVNVAPEVAATLLRHLQDNDASELAWNSRESSGRKKFRIKTIRRDYTLPPRTAKPITTTQLPQTAKIVLHSTLSPLSPESTLFPDGLINSKWIEKHQELVPCAFVSFYRFVSDSNISKIHDTQLTKIITREKSIITQSGYKSYLVVALISENSMSISPEVEERLSSIRREAGLDVKTSLLFLSSQNSEAELEGSVNNLITKIYPACIEYYRDLSKHSRRKKNRGTIPRPTVPPTSGTSMILSSHGWNFRYDFKLGVFAEFRQEMESALVSYEGAYETLLGIDVLEAIVSWSPRWDEARCLADVLALRMIRCLFWNGNYTAGARRWASHKVRIKDIVDRRGKGSATYGWEAWEARWATVMAEIISRVSIPAFGGSTIYLPIEKNIGAVGRIKPLEYLHHPGYWFLSASKHLIARRNLALQIPEENRSPPNFSPGLRNTSKDFIYDTYMCPEPHEEYPLPGHNGVDHSSLILECLGKAIREFEQKNQIHLVQEMKILSANELMNRNSWDEALKILFSLWEKMSYRKECWWNAVEEILLALRKAAVCVGDAGLVLTADWELMNKDFTYNNNLPYDFTQSMQNLDLKTRPVVVLRDIEVHSFLTASYTFESSKGNVGDICSSQFVVYSNAVLSSTPVTISEIKIHFEGNMKPITLKHEASLEILSCNMGPVTTRSVVLSDNPEDGYSELIGETFLSFQPSSTTVFELNNYLRESGEAKAITASFSMSADLFNLQYIHNLQSSKTLRVWWKKGSAKKKLVQSNASSITILPKPPKLKLLLNTQGDHIFINETTTLQLSIVNEEDFNSFVDLDVRILGDQAPQILLKNDITQISNHENTDQDSNHTDSKVMHVGKIAKGETASVVIVITPVELPAKFELLVKAVYHLDYDLKTQLYTTVSNELQIINPFELSYDFYPRIHPDPWPSLFTHEENIDNDLQESKANGIALRWCLSARFRSISKSNVIIEDVKTEILSTNDGTQCLVTKMTEIQKDSPSDAVKEIKFDVVTRNLDLDNLRNSSLDLSLIISWRRGTAGSSISHTKTPIPRLLASISEPRVIAEVSYSESPPLYINFDLMIENPSNHFLSFGLSMESSENFAFSGIKQSILQLLPLSRKKVQYRILPIVRSGWLGPVHCVIRDRYFQKVLRVIPTEGMKSDKERIMIWIPERG